MWHSRVHTLFPSFPPACSRNLNKFSPLKRHENLSLSLSFSLLVATHKNQSWHATGANKKKRGKKSSLLAPTIACVVSTLHRKSKLFACSFVLAKITFIYLSLLASFIGEAISASDTAFAKSEHAF